MLPLQRVLLAISIFLALGVVRSGAQQGAAPPSAAAPVITPDDMIENALKQFDAGDLREAAQIVERVRRLKPDHPRLLLIQGLYLIEGHKSAEALEALNKYNSNPDYGVKDYRGFAAVGGIYKRSRAYMSAVRPYELAAKLAPNEVNGKPVRAEIMIEYANVLEKLKRTKEAVKALKEAEGLAPNDAGVQFHLGQAALDTQDYPSALRYADRAIELTMGQLRSDPYKRAEHQLLKNGNELKISIAKALSASKPDDAQPFYIRADATRALGDVERRINLLEARDLAMQAISKDPKQYSWKIFQAQIELELGGIQDAIDHVNEVLKDDPQNAAAARFKAEIQERLKVSGTP